MWALSNRADPRARALADRHYNRQKPGTPQFMPPGSCVVFRTLDDRAVWGTSWPTPAYVKHAWAGAWVNSIFRNERAGLSSTLIREAVAATRYLYGPVPSLGMVTFVDSEKVRHKRDPGRCYLRAGFHPAQCPVHTTAEKTCAACAHRTVGGLLAFQMLAADMPPPSAPLGYTLMWRFTDTASTEGGR
jgi:hypothetical protein